MPKTQPSPLPESARTDHEGTVYPSMNAMCLAWGVDPRTFAGRVRKGWPLERALSKDPGRDLPRQCRPDPGSVRNLAMRTGIAQATVRYRMSKGMALGEALAAPVKETDGPRTDHLGREYPDTKAMCAAWGTGPDTFRYRMAHGRTLEEALTDTTAVRDPFGTEFRSKAAACRAWGILPSALAPRTGDGGTVAAAIASAAADGWPGKRIGGYRIASCPEFPWFLVENTENGRRAVLHARTLLREAEQDAGRKKNGTRKTREGR